ncbi:hypothetical protein ACFYZB_15045 [Streptomyces sp. NPDC001852]
MYSRWLRAVSPGSGNLSDEPTSRKAGQNLVTYTTVRNAKSAPLSGVLFD